jgi:hypothetical protein
MAANPTAYTVATNTITAPAVALLLSLFKLSPDFFAGRVRGLHVLSPPHIGNGTRIGVA